MRYFIEVVTGWRRLPPSPASQWGATPKIAPLKIGPLHEENNSPLKSHMAIVSKFLEFQLERVIFYLENLSHFEFLFVLMKPRIVKPEWPLRLFHEREATNYFGASSCSNRWLFCSLFSRWVQIRNNVLLARHWALHLLRWQRTTCLTNSSHPRRRLCTPLLLVLGLFIYILGSSLFLSNIHIKYYFIKTTTFQCPLSQEYFSSWTQSLGAEGEPTEVSLCRHHLDHVLS